MQKIEFVMGMPIIVEAKAPISIFNNIFDYFCSVDERFSPYKQNSEVTKINELGIMNYELSKDMSEILRLAEETKKETNGYFDVYHNGGFDPSGIVKGWAIYNASKILDKMGVKDYYVNAGGDIQTRGRTWAVGIRNPFKTNENVKVVYLSGEGIATSGTYEKGNHIYNPFQNRSHRKNLLLRGLRQNGAASREFFDDAHDIVSLTVIGPNVYEADRFATAAFAMGKDGINFIEKQKGLEGYMINKNGIGTMTSGFEKYI